MATVEKLPSGKYRAKVYLGKDESGKSIRKSFTANTRKEAVYLASRYEQENHTGDQSLTFEKALEGYISNRTNTLSPSTIREYRRSQKSDYELINKISIDKITQEDIQRVVNEMAFNHSPKTVRNRHSLIVSVFKMYRPNFTIRTMLPQPIKPMLNIPTDEDVKVLLENIKNEDLMIAVLLASFGPMRRSEISALRSEDIEGDIVHIHNALVLNENDEFTVKTTKTVSSDRLIKFPAFVIEKINKKEGNVCNLNPTQISKRFTYLCNKCGIDIRFHDLRHYSASIQHAMGIPDAYIMERGGWKTDRTLKAVYRHALSDQSNMMNDKINQYFDNKFNNQ